jgi:Polyketide cyclase / dehydrase and lipid transport
MSIEVIRDFDCAPAVLWAIVGAPERSDWVPGVTACEFDGEVRRMTMAGAGQVAERIFRVDDAAMEIEYGVIESRAPLESHRASIALQSIPGGTQLTWKTDVMPVAVEKFIRRAMEESLVQLASMVNPQS